MLVYGSAAGHAKQLAKTIDRTGSLLCLSPRPARR